MKRDGLTEIEAKKLILDTQEEIFNDPDNAEDIIADNLGLEMDYIFNVLNFEI